MRLLKRFTASLLVGLTILVASAAAQSAASGHYLVRSGDNLSVIAQRYGTTVRQIKTDNSLRSDVIHVGQKLKLGKPFARKTSAPRWQKPCANIGRVIKPYGQYKKKNILMPQTGVVMACPTGSRITAAADGIVRHIGPLDGFGTLIIIEHAGRFATVLAPLDQQSVSVAVGQAVRRGDFVGRTGAPEDDREPYLHIELRRRDKAIAPDRLLK